MRSTASAWIRTSALPPTDRALIGAPDRNAESAVQQAKSVRILVRSLLMAFLANLSILTTMARRFVVFQELGGMGGFAMKAATGVGGGAMAGVVTAPNWATSVWNVAIGLPRSVLAGSLSAISIIAAA